MMGSDSLADDECHWPLSGFHHFPAALPYGRMDDIRIVLAEERHAEGLRTAYEDICSERVYFSVLQAPPLETILRHMQTLRQNGGVHYVAVAAPDLVVGWCDVTRNAREIESCA